MSKPTILVTGANGFIGSHLLNALIAQKYDVIVLKRASSDLWRIENLEGQYKSYDIDKAPIILVFEEQKIDCVIHLSTAYKKYEGQEDIPEMINSNVTFPSELLECAVRFGVKGFINTGTYFEINCSKQPVDEKAECFPFNFYAKTKLAFETILKNYKNEISINTLRLFSPFGEKDNPKLIQYIIKSLLEDRQVALSEGYQKIDLVYCGDIINAYLKALERLVEREFRPEYEVFNIGSGFPLSIRDIVSMIEELHGTRLKVNWGEKTKNDYPIVYSDNSKASEMLGWEPCIGVKKGLANTLNYYKKNL